MKKSEDIRKEFIEFFKEKNHTQVMSAPVVPFDDPTLLFTNAYHHSFFEMLGNWSFGDYYKKEAIEWAWELLTDKWKLDKKRLYASVYTTDDEAEQLWKDVTDIEHSHIQRFDEVDNFWQMGDTGPCGPCSEIHYDRGEEYCNMKDVKGHVCSVNGDCERIIEIWNLVFIQYNRDKEGKLHDLPNKHVDTGMGFERICMVLQNSDSNYHIDLFKDLISEIESITGTKYEKDERGIPHRVIADHLRALTFSISDGALPSNEGRGYVLRRILRRALRYGLKLGMNEPFIYRLVGKLSELMGDIYPEIIKFRKHTENIIKSEEKSFLRTLSKGVSLFNEISEELKNSGKTIIPGADTFKLYDTFGFPKDLTAQMAEEIGFTIDEKGFDAEMKNQREKSKKGSKFKTQKVIDWIVLNDKNETEFVGYSTTSGESKVIKYGIDGKEILIVPEYSYLYAESGGQVSDKGMVSIEGQEYRVNRIYKDGNYIAITINIPEKPINFNEDMVLSQFCDKDFRDKCRANHSATHLLQSTIKEVVGDHVAQSGSYVDDKGLRFDYSHFDKLTLEEIGSIEYILNKKIRENLPVVTEEKSIDEAKKMGATALFGEKYGDNVRVVSMGDFSMELCGGTHVKRSGDIGQFKIISETSISSGIRRIEAVTGDEAVVKSRKDSNFFDSVKEQLVCKESQVDERFTKLIEDKKALEKEIKALKEEIALMQISSLKSSTEEIKGINVIRSIVKVADGKILKTMGENLRNEIKSGIILLGADINGKASLVVAVTDDLKGDYKAGALIGTIAKEVKGGGGGAPHIATAGGKDPNGLPNAIKLIEDLI